MVARCQRQTELRQQQRLCYNQASLHNSSLLSLSCRGELAYAHLSRHSLLLTESLSCSSACEGGARVEREERFCIACANRLMALHAVVTLITFHGLLCGHFYLEDCFFYYGAGERGEPLHCLWLRDEEALIG